MKRHGTRAAILLGIMPIVVAAIYFVTENANGSMNTTDAAGVTMLIALGLAMGFGFLVILRGAKDL